jgi:hypothetical protein
VPAPTINPVVAGLEHASLYVNAEDGGRHRVVCPWRHEHETDAQVDTFYHEPSASHGIGGFRCSGRHTEERRIGALLDHLGLSADDARCKAKIRCVAGELNRVVTAAEQVLAAGGDHFNAGGMIVTVRSAPSGDAFIEAANEQTLSRVLSDLADWERFDGRSKAPTRCDPPQRYIQPLLRTQSFAHLPSLEGIARQPYFDTTSGTLIETCGYDRQTGMYGAFDPKLFPVDSPTFQRASRALDLLKKLLEEFHFSSEVDRSAALAAILTAAVRPTLSLAPAFSISATSPGSGKSYLADVIAAFAGPGQPLKASYPTTADEATKTMLSLLLPKPAVIVFDDMQTDWLPHGTINRALTSESITDRLLGVSRTATVTTRTLLLGTGNNISAVRDMARRVIPIRLDTGSDSPMTIRYRQDPGRVMREHRPLYVALALTIIQAWLEAGSPKTDVLPIASFNGDWSNLCRHPLIWLGEADPASGLIEQVRNEPDAENLHAFLKAWHSAVGSKPITLRMLVAKAEADGTQISDLRDAIFDLPVIERGTINRSKLGWFLKRSKGRVVGNMRIVDANSSERKAWCVELI